MTEAPVFDYVILDDLAEQTYAAVLAVWLLRTELDAREWLALVLDVLALAVLQAEQMGRLLGGVSGPLDGGAPFPTDEVARRPAPEGFEQRSGRAPAPAPDLAGRESEIRGRLGCGKRGSSTTSTSR